MAKALGRTDLPKFEASYGYRDYCCARSRGSEFWKKDNSFVVWHSMQS